MSKRKTTINEKTLTPEFQINVTDVNINVAQKVIVTTEDKLRLCLLRHLQYIGKKRGWTTPLAIFLTVIVTCVTTTFKDVGLSASTWQAVFAVMGGLSFVWLVWSIYQALKAKKLEDIISELRG